MTRLSSMQVIKPKALNIFMIENREGGVCCLLATLLVLHPKNCSQFQIEICLGRLQTGNTGRLQTLDSICKSGHYFARKQSYCGHIETESLISLSFGPYLFGIILSLLLHFPKLLDLSYFLFFFFSFFLCFLGLLFCKQSKRRNCKSTSMSKYSSRVLYKAG